MSRELMRVELKPEARQKQMELESSRLMENLTSPEVHSVHGFVTVYAFLCRYYGIPFREDVAWVSRDVCVCVCVCLCVYVLACMRVCRRVVCAHEGDPLLFNLYPRCDGQNVSVWWVIAHRTHVYISTRLHGWHAH